MSDDRYLTEADIDRIAERAAERALEKVYTEIGRSVVKKILYIFGVAGLIFGSWLVGSGFFNK